MRHPDHQSGMISEGMIRARMAEEIADLRAEVERLRADRRERIATACLAARLSENNGGGYGPEYNAKLATRYADALINELDKEAQP
jgi:hypothetical protein